MQLLTDQYPVVLKQDVLWGDMDTFGHVNNTVYFRYFEDARLVYFEKTGILKFKDQTNIGPILANTHCNFKLPLKYPDAITYCWPAPLLRRLKKLLCNIRFTVMRCAATAAEGEGLLVYYDYNQGKSCEIPKEIVAAMNDI